MKQIQRNLRTLNAQGFSHVIVPLLIVVAIGVVGSYLLVKSHADPVASTTATNIAYAHKGLPSINLNTTRTTQQNQSGNNSTSCSDGCYFYSGGYQPVTATGASVSLAQAQPVVGAKDSHSLAEMSVESDDGQNIIEVGWIVAKEINKDTAPHLFVYHWVNGYGSCYNGCGFVSVKSTTPAGSKVTVGVTAKYQIKFASNQWLIYYNNVEIGYFPESLWNGTYKQAGYIQVFGEVASSSATKPLTQMGNGILGTSTGSIAASNFALIGSTTAPNLSMYDAPNTSMYNYGAATKTGFRFGGHGYVVY